MRPGEEKQQLSPSQSLNKPNYGNLKTRLIEKTGNGEEDDSSSNTPILWQIAITFICFLAHFMESFGSHGFVVLIAKAYLEKTVTLWLLGGMAAIPVVLALLLLPSLIYLYQRSPCFYRVSGFFGFFLLGASFLTSAFVPQQIYYFFTYSVPFGMGSALLLACTSQLINSYYPRKNTCQRISSFFIAMGFPLGAILGFFVYAIVFVSSFSKFWFLVIMAVINFGCALVLGMFMKPKEQGFFYLECHSTEEEKKRLKKLRMEVENPCFAYLSLAKCGRRPLMLFWLSAEVVCGAFWFSLRTYLVIFFIMNGKFDLLQASLFMCAFGGGQTVVILFALLVGSYMRVILPIFHLFSAMGLCAASGVIIYLPITTTHYYIITAALGFCVQLSLSFTYPNAEKVMKIGFGRSFVLTASALSLGVALSVVSGGLLLDLMKQRKLFFFAQMGGWGLLAILHLILCVLYYLFKIIK